MDMVIIAYGRSNSKLHRSIVKDTWAKRLPEGIGLEFFSYEDEVDSVGFGDLIDCKDQVYFEAAKRWAEKTSFLMFCPTTSYVVLERLLCSDYKSYDCYGDFDGVFIVNNEFLKELLAARGNLGSILANKNFKTSENEKFFTTSTDRYFVMPNCTNQYVVGCNFPDLAFYLVSKHLEESAPIPLNAYVFHGADIQEHGGLWWYRSKWSERFKGPFQYALSAELAFLSE